MTAQPRGRARYGVRPPTAATPGSAQSDGYIGGLPDVVTDGKTGFLVESKSPQSISDAVIHFFEPGVAGQLASGVRKENYRFSWVRMVEHIEEFTHDAVKDENMVAKKTNNDMRTDVKATYILGSDKSGGQSMSLSLQRHLGFVREVQIWKEEQPYL